MSNSDKNSGSNSGNSNSGSSGSSESQGSKSHETIKVQPVMVRENFSIQSDKSEKKNK